MNPYNFVRLGQPARRQSVVQHDRFSHNSGIITCHIKIITPLFVGQPYKRSLDRHAHPQLGFLRVNGVPLLPGSSLKGACRSIAEAVSGSCLILPDDPHNRFKDNDKLSYVDRYIRSTYNVAPGFIPCGVEQDSDQVCPACRIFGYLYKKNVYSGNVSFSDAHPCSKYNFEWLTLAPSGTPAPRHRPFYGTSDSDFKTIRGRKFYYHRVQGALTSMQKTGQNKTVEAIMPEAEFEFNIDYNNLDDADLALLIFSLVLEEPMRHKIGMGKGVGLGSVKIVITEWQQINAGERYHNLNGGKTFLTGTNLASALAQQIQAYHHHYADWHDMLGDLHTIWDWDENDGREFQYPSFTWFKEFKKTPLEDVPDDAGTFRDRPQVRAPRPIREEKPKPAPPPLDPATEKELRKLRREMEQYRSDTPSKKSPYLDREIEKAKILTVEANSITVNLGKIPESRFEVKKKNPYRPYNVGAKTRVRIFVNPEGEITRVEEV